MAGLPDLRDLEHYAIDDRQREVLKLCAKHGVTGAAEKLGVNLRNVTRMLQRLRMKRDATEVGYGFPADVNIPPGHELVGQSTYTRTDEGDPAWIKTRPVKEEQTQEELDNIRTAFLDSLPKAKRSKDLGVNTLRHLSPDLLNMFIITDYHIGMKAWHEETGADWDTDIAEDMLYRWFATAIRSAPKAETAVFAQMGDFLHWDGIEAVTPTNRHILDADTRFQKLVRVAIRSIRRIIRELLETHQNVHVIMAEGNHDIASSMWLREMLHSFYAEEPRVSVDVSADPYYEYQFGKVSLFVHHGHKRKPHAVDHVLAAKFRATYGNTSHSYAHLGHLHHNKILETNLMHVEQHQTLAAPDAHASRGGWMSGRSAKVITYHRKFGEVSRFGVTPEILGEGT